LLPDTFIQRLANAVSPDTIRRHLQRLQDFRTRNSPTESCRAAEQYVAGYFTELGLDSVKLDSYQSSGQYWRNVVGTRRGRLNPDAVVIICGHMDATSENPNVSAPGAEDNGSGTCMAIEAARVLAHEPLDYTVKFVAFTGEEQGLLGSTHYAQVARLQGVNIVGVLNFDMIAWPGGDWGIKIVSDSNSEPLAVLEDQMAATYTSLSHVVVVRAPLGSDQYPFQVQGYQAIAGIEYGHIGYQWYHTTGDTIGNLSMPLAAEVAKCAIATAVTMMAIPAPPTGFTLADAGTGGCLNAEWLPNPDPDLTGYRLFCGQTTGLYTDSVTLVPGQHQVPITGLQNGTRYYAAVKAFDSSGNVSKPCREQSAVPYAIPLAPASLAALPGWFAMRLNWPRNHEADLVGYNLYRTTDTLRGFQRVNSGLLTDSCYRDSSLCSDTMYFYAVRAVDRDSNESNRSPAARGKPVTLDHGILLVDETRNGNGLPGNPNDAQVDSFYHDMLRGYSYSDWDVNQQGVPLAGDIGPYSCIVWHGDDIQEQRIAYAVSGLDNYLSYGGKLWLVGWKPLYAVMNQTGSYPFHFAPGQFPYSRLHLLSAGLAQNQDFIGAFGMNGYPDAAIDSLKMLSGMHGKLPFVELLGLRDADTILRYQSFSGDTLVQGKPVGLRWLNGPGKVVFFSFPFYYTRTIEARPVALKVMQDLGEPYAVGEARSQAPSSSVSLRVCPSVSHSNARIEWTLPRAGWARLELFDVAGKRVTTLVKGRLDAGAHYRELGHLHLAHGVYLARLETGTGTAFARFQLAP
jgi:hypothetical protein